jgi:hypothetical protein
MVERDDALRIQPGSATNVRRIIVRTKPYDPRESLPRILAQAKKDFEDKMYSKVVDSGKSILKIEPEQAEANLLMGLSYYMMALGDTNTAHATEMYSESYNYLAKALELGEDVSLPVKHHHAEFLDQDLCSGYITLKRDAFEFNSTSISGHGFNVPLSRIYELGLDPDVAGRLHTRVGILTGKKEAKKNYNFHSAEVRMVRETTWLTPTAPISSNNIYCTVACQPSMEVIYKLLRHLMQTKAMQPPRTP